MAYLTLNYKGKMKKRLADGADNKAPGRILKF